MRLSSLKPLWLPLKVAATLGLLGFVLHRYVDPAKLPALAAGADWRWVTWLVLGGLVQRLLQAVQGAWCFRHFGAPVTVWQVCRAQWIATFYAFVLPGDLVAGGVSWHYLARDSGRPAATAGALVYLRLLHLLALVPLAGLGMVLDPRLLASGAHRYVALTTGVALLAGLPLFSARAGRWARELTDRLLLHRRLRALVETGWAAVEPAQNMPFGLLTRLAVASLLTHAVGALTFMTAMRLAGLDLPVSVGLWLLGLMTLVHTLPLTIAGLGLRELSLVTLLDRLHGVPAEQSLLLSLWLFLSTLLIGGGGGALLTLVEHWRGGSRRRGTSPVVTVPPEPVSELRSA